MDEGNGGIWKNTTSQSSFCCYFSFLSGITFIGDTINYNDLNFRVQLIDLTLMFGIQIADYINTLETTASGSGIACLKQWGFFGVYEISGASPYIFNVHPYGLRTVGFNQIQADNVPIKLLGNVEYQITGSYYGAMASMRDHGAFVFDESYFDADGKFTPPVDCDLYVLSPGDNACLHFVLDGSRDGDYEPYKENYYECSAIELYGIPKLDASNKLYYDGDTYSSDGTITRKYSYDVGYDMSWHETTNNGVNFYWSSSLQHKPGSLNILCSYYPTYTTTINGFSSSLPDKHLFIVSGSSVIYIRDDDYDGLPSFSEHIYSAGFVYERPYTQTSSANPFEKNQVVDPWGVEISNEDSIGIIPVQQSASYYIDFKSKVEELIAKPTITAVTSADCVNIQTPSSIAADLIQTGNICELRLVNNVTSSITGTGWETLFKLPITTNRVHQFVCIGGTSVALARIYTDGSVDVYSPTSGTSYYGGYTFLLT